MDKMTWQEFQQWQRWDEFPESADNPPLTVLRRRSTVKTCDANQR